MQPYPPPSRATATTLSASSPGFAANRKYIGWKRSVMNPARRVPQRLWWTPRRLRSFKLNDGMKRARPKSSASNGALLADTLYDVAIIGSGPAGYTAAIRGGEYGLKVALIESEAKLGGPCLHVGCIPTKALLFNAEIWDHLKHAAEYGIAGIGTPQLDWAAVQKRKNGIVTKHTKGLEFLMKKNKVTVVPGFGKLTGPAKDGVHTVQLTG